MALDWKQTGTHSFGIAYGVLQSNAMAEAINTLASHLKFRGMHNQFVDINRWLRLDHLPLSDGQRVAMVKLTALGFVDYKKNKKGEWLRISDKAKIEIFPLEWKP